MEVTIPDAFKSALIAYKEEKRSSRRNLR